MHCQRCGGEMPDGICETLGCPDGMYRQLPAIIDPNGEVTEESIERLFPVQAEHEPRMKFLAFRYQGFTLLEAQKKAGVNIRQIQYWRRTDDVFRELELGLLGPNRNQIRKEMFGMAYLRNYALILEKDNRVLTKDMEMGKEALTDQEHAYLRQIRKFYTPAQAVQLQAFIDGLGIKRPEGEDEGTFGAFIHRITKKVETTEEFIG